MVRSLQPTCCSGEGRRLGRRPQDEQVLVHTTNRIQTVLQATRHVPRSSSWQWLKTHSVTGVQGVHLPTWLSASSKWSQIKARKSLGMMPITRPILIQRLEVARAPGLTPSVGTGPWGRGAGRTSPGLLERPLARL